MQVQEQVLTVQEESTQIQQHQIHHQHWEKTEKTTLEMVVAVALEVAEPLEVFQETVVQETKVVLVDVQEAI